MGRENSVRCPEKSMETPSIPSSTALASSPLVPVTAARKLFPDPASTQAPPAAPVASPRVLPPSQMPCTQMSSEGLMRKEIDVRCPAKSMETPSIPWSTSHASSPLVAVTTSPELFPAAASTEGPLAPPVSSEGLMGRKSNVGCPEKSMEIPSIPSSTTLASSPLVAMTPVSELFPTEESKQAPLAPLMGLPPSQMRCANVSSEGLMGRKSNGRCPAKSMETPSIPPSTALASSPLVAVTTSSEQFPAAASAQATLATPVAPVMVLPPSEIPCAHVSSEGSCSTKTCVSGSKDDKQNPSKKDDHYRTKRKNRAVIEDEIEAHFQTLASENGALSDAISIMPKGRMKDIPADDDDDDRRTSKLRYVGPNHVSESLSSSSYICELNYERMRKRVEEELREEMEAKFEAQEYEYLAQLVEVKELQEKVMAEKDAQLENFNRQLETQMKAMTEMKEWLVAMLTIQGRPVPPFLMPTPVEKADLDIPTHHDH